MAAIGRVSRTTSSSREYIYIVFISFHMFSKLKLLGEDMVMVHGHEVVPVWDGAAIEFFGLLTATPLATPSGE